MSVATLDPLKEAEPLDLPFDQMVSIGKDMMAYLQAQWKKYTDANTVQLSEGPEVDDKTAASQGQPLVSDAGDFPGEQPVAPFEPAFLTMSLEGEPPVQMSHWVSAGVSKFGTPKWKNVATQEVVYQEKMPGDFHPASHTEASMHESWPHVVTSDNTSHNNLWLKVTDHPKVAHLLLALGAKLSTSQPGMLSVPKTILPMAALFLQRHSLPAPNAAAEAEAKKQLALPLDQKDPKALAEALKKVNPHQLEPTWAMTGQVSPVAYGGVVFNDQGKVLLRKPTNKFDGYHWTFAKGGRDAGEHPVDTALREVGEESGQMGRIIGMVPGNFKGGGSPHPNAPPPSQNFYFLMHSAGHDPSLMDKETEATVWATPAEAAKLIGQTTNEGGKKRDLAILSAASQAYAKLKGLPPPAAAAPAPAAAPPAPKGAPPDLFSPEKAKAHIEKLSQVSGLSSEQIRSAMTAHAQPGSTEGAQAAKHRAHLEAMIMQHGLHVEDAIAHLLAHAHDTKAASAFAAQLTTGDKAKSEKEYAETALYDLQILSKITVKDSPIQGQAVCNMGSRSLTMGSTSVTGDYRHELGHAVHAALGGFGPQTPINKMVDELYAEVMKKAKADPIGTKQKMDYDWYEEKYGIIGKRALDNAKENFAEHYRGYQRELYKDRHEGGNGARLALYRKRHPGWAKLWDAHYTAALLGALATKGVW
jgi:8-oxo-dGTP diphosphatase